MKKGKQVTTETAPTTATYTRSDVALLGEFPVIGPYSTANRYQIGDSYYLVVRHRRNAAQNAVLQASNLGYGPSYEEYTEMQVAQLPDQHGDKPWVPFYSFTSDDEEDGIKAILDHANGLLNTVIALLEETAGAVDLTDTPILAEAQAAVEAASEVDVDTDPVMDGSDQGPEPTVEEDGNTEDVNND